MWDEWAAAYPEYLETADKRRLLRQICMEDVLMKRLLLLRLDKPKFESLFSAAFRRQCAACYALGATRAQRLEASM